MRQYREGQKVAYVGDGDHGLAPGDRGKVLSSEPGAAHVLWMSGAQQGGTLFHTNYDLVAHEAEAYDTDFYGAPLVTTAVRDTFDREGPEGLLNALNEEGHLATFGSHVEEAIAMVSSRIRQEPAFIEIMAELDVDEGEEVLSMATFALLVDAFGEGEDV